MPDSPWPDMFTLSDSDREYLVGQARAAEVVKQIAASDPQAKAAEWGGAIASKHYISPHEMSKMLSDAALLGHSCLQQVASGEVKHVPWPEVQDPPHFSLVSPERQWFEEQNRLGVAIDNQLTCQEGFEKYVLGLAPVTWKKPLDPMEWKAAMEQKAAVLGSDFGPTVQVTEEMLAEGAEVISDTPDPTSHAAAKCLASEVYLAMHAVAPVELVSDGELRAVKERDEAYGYLRRVFEHVAPQCTPFPDLMGICTQVDNVLAGARIDLKQANEKLRNKTEYFQRETANRLHPGEVEALLSQLRTENDELKRRLATADNGSMDVQAVNVQIQTDNMFLRDIVTPFMASNVAHVDSTPKPDFTSVPTDDPRRMGWRGVK